MLFERWRAKAAERREAAAAGAAGDRFDTDAEELGALAPVARWLASRSLPVSLRTERMTHGWPPPHAIVSGPLSRPEVEAAFEIGPWVGWAYGASGWSLLDLRLGTAVYGTEPGDGSVDTASDGPKPRTRIGFLDLAPWSPPATEAELDRLGGALLHRRVRADDPGLVRTRLARLLDTLDVTADDAPSILAALPSWLVDGLGADLPEPGADSAWWHRHPEALSWVVGRGPLPGHWTPGRLARALVTAERGWRVLELGSPGAGGFDLTLAHAPLDAPLDALDVALRAAGAAEVTASPRS